MKINLVFKKAIYLIAVVGLISLSANSSFSQQVKKKLVRVIEVDDKGERVVKEYNVSNDAAKFDSITHDVCKKIKVEQNKMDSLQHILMRSLPNRSEFPLMPDMPELPDLNFGFDMPEAPFFGSDHDFDFFTPDSVSNSAKIYYSEKNFDKSENLDKILQDLENGTFDPKKWDMKEVEKDKIKDFKTKGKGEVIVFGNRAIAPPHIRYFHGNTGRGARVDMRRGKKGHQMIYFDADSLDKKNFETYFIESSGDSDGELCEKIRIMSPDDSGHKRIKGHRMVIYSNDSIDNKGKMETFTINSSDDSDDPNCEKVIVVTSDGMKRNISMNVKNDGKKEKEMVFYVENGKSKKIEFSKPSIDDIKTLEKSDLIKEDKTKLISARSLTLIPQKEKDKFTINFEEKETGKVKIIITNDKGKIIQSVYFEHAGGNSSKEIELKDLKSGTYFIQAQLNGKTATRKLEITID